MAGVRHQIERGEHIDPWILHLCRRFLHLILIVLIDGTDFIILGAFGEFRVRHYGECGRRLGGMFELAGTVEHSFDRKLHLLRRLHSGEEDPTRQSGPAMVWSVGVEADAHFTVCGVVRLQELVFI